MMNQIKMKSVRELIRKRRATTPERYRIPDYQRGYRWRAKEQVKALLEDVAGFMNQTKQSDEIYCLQPIVVATQADDQGSYWELIDGQQRLTTLYLILHYLKSEEVYNIDFAVRKDSTDFLRDLAIKGIMSNDRPDFHFMSETYRFICGWFEEQQKQSVRFKRNFEATLLDSVQVIWYEVELSGEEQEKIDIFNRLNIGKIPLDDAELIRALLLNHVRGASPHEETLRKGIFATEWLEMEYFLRQEAVWDFLYPAQAKSKLRPRNRILGLFELLAKAKAKQGRATFRYFEEFLWRSETVEERELQVQDFWEELKQVFAFLRLCYLERKLYHRAGLCISLGIVSLAELAEMRRLDKNETLSTLEEKLKKHFTKIDWGTLSYEKNKSEVQQVLLLFNVLTLDKMKGTEENRFPFALYNGDRWSIEHIHAQNGKGLIRSKERLEWITYALDSLEGVEALPRPEGLEDDFVLRPLSEIKGRLKVIKESRETKGRKGNQEFSPEESESFEQLSRDLELYLSGGASIHELDNLSLLGFGANAALSNSYFPVKRKKLLKLELDGNFIPPCTRNVFLKVYSPANSCPYLWDTRDKHAYLQAMQQVLVDYITIDIPLQNEQ